MPVAEDERVFSFLTNNFDKSAITITTLYKARWKIEVFYKWIN